MAESYSERHGRKPPISVEALVEIVFRRLRDFEKRDYFYEAFHTYIDPAGGEHPARLPHPEEYLITHLARPGLWDWLGDLERVVDERDFPPWDFDTLFDVIELFHNLVVAAPSLDFDGTFEGWWSQPAGQREFREAINEILDLSDPPTRLTEAGRILETGPAAPALPESAQRLSTTCSCLTPTKTRTRSFDPWPRASPTVATACSSTRTSLSSAMTYISALPRL
jgi:hypothetical protein